MDERNLRRRSLLQAASDDNEDAVHDLVRRLLDAGADPYEILEDLESIREDLGEIEDEKVTGVMDRFVGWCASGQGMVSDDQMNLLAERWLRHFHGP